MNKDEFKELIEYYVLDIPRMTESQESCEETAKLVEPHDKELADAIMGIVNTSKYFCKLIKIRTEKWKSDYVHPI